MATQIAVQNNWRQDQLSNEQIFQIRCQSERFVVWGFVPLVVPRGQYRRTGMWGRFDQRREDLQIDSDGFFLNNTPLISRTTREINVHRPPLCTLPSKFIIGPHDALYIDEDGGIWLGHNDLPLFGPMSKIRQAEFTRHVEKSSHWKFLPYWHGRLNIDGTVVTIQ